MKNKNFTIQIAAVVVTAIILLSFSAHAVFVLGPKTKVTPFQRNTITITQSATGLITVQDVYESTEVSGDFVWAVYIKNTGAAALSDLNVLLNNEDANWDDAPVNLVDAQGVATSFNVGCTTTLAIDTTCIIGVGASAPLGWMKVTAAATAETSITVTFIARNN